MVVGYHLIWTAYGTWLPNDPRGGSSRVIHSDVIAELGELHFGRKKIQPMSREFAKFQEQAKCWLEHELLIFEPNEIQSIGNAFAEVISRNRYTCYACAIMQDHVHLLIRKHKQLAEQMLLELQHSSRSAVSKLGKRDLMHPVWGGKGWKVYLDSQADMERTVRYVEKNPIKARLPAQIWTFVKQYDGWLPRLHPEHQGASSRNHERVERG